MSRSNRLLFAAIAVLLATSGKLFAADDGLIPPLLPKEQRDNLQRFLLEHAAPDRYIPKDAKLVDSQPDAVDMKIAGTAEKPIKQYTVQITSHRPVPDQPTVNRVDVVYYRPNPEKGKHGITVKYTVDLTTGKQVGDTEVLRKSHTPISREELTEAVALAREKSPALQSLYKGRDAKAVRWEYLQLLINRKNDQSEPGDRVVRLVFKASPADANEEPIPVPVVVNLTKGGVTDDAKR